MAPITSSSGLTSPLGGFRAATLLDAPKHEPLALRLSAHGTPLHLDKNPGESVEHLVLKAFMWALVLPTHPNAQCELDLGLRYRPDVVSLDAATGSSTPLFWGECGSVKPRKLKALAEAFPSTAFAVAKWGRSDLRGYAANLRTELDLPADRAAPFELLNFPSTSIDDFLSDDGEIAIGFDDLTIVDLRPSQEEEQSSSRGRGGKSRRRR